MSDTSNALHLHAGYSHQPSLMLMITRTSPQLTQTGQMSSNYDHTARPTRSSTQNSRGINLFDRGARNIACTSSQKEKQNEGGALKQASRLQSQVISVQNRLCLRARLSTPGPRTRSQPVCIAKHRYKNLHSLYLGQKRRSIHRFGSGKMGVAEFTPIDSRVDSG